VAFVALVFVVGSAGICRVGVAYIVWVGHSSCGCGVGRAGVHHAGAVFIALAFVIPVVSSSSCVLVAHITVSTSDEIFDRLRKRNFLYLLLELLGNDHMQGINSLEWLVGNSGGGSSGAGAATATGAAVAAWGSGNSGAASG